MWTTVVGPAQADFLGPIVRELAGGRVREIEGVNLIVFEFFLTLVWGARDKGKLAAVAGGNQIVYPQG